MAKLLWLNEFNVAIDPDYVVAIEASEIEEEPRKQHGIQHKPPGTPVEIPKRFGLFLSADPYEERPSEVRFSSLQDAIAHAKHLMDQINTHRTQSNRNASSN